MSWTAFRPGNRSQSGDFGPWRTHEAGASRLFGRAPTLQRWTCAFRARTGPEETCRSARRAGRETSRRAEARARSSAALVYGGFVLGLWGVIAVAGLVAYHAAQLPPIDQLSVPKRPPNIAILASDGALLANRGETGGRQVALKELPPHLPQAFIAIEDRRFYDHLGIDPVGLARAAGRAT